jgi:hypothetical protein
MRILIFKGKQLWKSMAIFFFVSFRLPLIPAKHGIEQNQSRKADKILGPAHHNNYERKGRPAAERVINALPTSMSLTHALIQ